MESWVARAARMHGARAALVGRDGAELTYSELHGRASQVAGALVGQDVGPGDRVALALPSRDLVVALHACMAIGAVAVPVDLRLLEAERELRTRGAALVLDELGAGTGGDVGVALSGPGQSGLSEPGETAVSERDPAEVATIMYTSGTTAGPKEVALSYRNWLANAVGSALALGLHPAERWLCPMPLAHVGGLSIQIRSAIYATTVVLHERFDTEGVLEALRSERQRITLVSLVPTMLSRLLDAGLREPPTLRRALLGGGPIAPSLLARAQAAGVDVAPTYGMTEACSQIATDGWPLFGVQLSLAGDGEVLVRGPNVAVGALAQDGWLHTGDRGTFDPDGRLVIEGRIADTIITGGENVAPIEVEAVLLEHPAVVDVAVLGRPDDEWGEVVVAQVVLRDRGDGGTEGRGGSDRPDPEALRFHCAARLAPFKVPKHFEVVASVPRGTTGKLLRRELR